VRRSGEYWILLCERFPLGFDIVMWAHVSLSLGSWDWERDGQQRAAAAAAKARGARLQLFSNSPPWCAARGPHVACAHRMPARAGGR
jgi:hypothetical protein